MQIPVTLRFLIPIAALNFLIVLYLTSDETIDQMGLLCIYKQLL